VLLVGGQGGAKVRGRPLANSKLEVHSYVQRSEMLPAECSSACGQFDGYKSAVSGGGKEAVGDSGRQWEAGGEEA